MTGPCVEVPTRAGGVLAGLAIECCPTNGEPHQSLDPFRVERALHYIGQWRRVPGPGLDTGARLVIALRGGRPEALACHEG
jgi:hypothetical protein